MARATGISHILPSAFPHCTHTHTHFPLLSSPAVILSHTVVTMHALSTDETLCLILMAAAYLKSPKWETKLRVLLIALHFIPPSTPIKLSGPPFPYIQRTWCGCGISQGRLQEAISACESPIFFNTHLFFFLISVFLGQL